MIFTPNFKRASSLFYLYETRGVVVAIALNIAARVRRVVIPIVTLPGTWSRGINKENHPIMTNKPDGR